MKKGERCEDVEKSKVLNEIKDIRDELNIIRRVLYDQKSDPKIGTYELLPGMEWAGCSDSRN